MTRLADARDADAAPAGGWAVAVRGRYGASELVRVDLSTGTSEAIAATLPVDEDWPVWSHPRISPDGKRIAALLHAGRRWRLVTLPAGGGEAREISLGAPPVGAPSWSPDGSRLFVAVAASGTWNLASVDATGAAPERLLTRVTGGAFGPSVAAGGKELFFLDLRARGVSIRRLPLGEAALETEAVESARLPAPFPPGEVSSPRAYDPWRSQAIRPLLDFSFGPSGNTVQLGVDGGDVLGRLHYLAMGSMGDAVGPRGGSAAAAYRGLPVVLDAQFFSAIEKPGNQGLAPRPAFDQERWGGFADASWSRPFVWGRIETRAGGGGTRVESFAEDRAFTRGLGSADVKIAFRRTRGRSGFGFDAAASGSVGATAGSGWSQWAAGGRLLGILPFATLSAAGRYGDTGGSPSLFDLYAIGGAPNAILPPGLDSNRILSPALPADIQAGRRFEAFRAELDAAVVPILLYAEWLRAWSDLSAGPGARGGRRAAPRAADSARIRQSGHVPRGGRLDRQRHAPHPGRARICSAHLQAMRSMWVRPVLFAVAAAAAACASKPAAPPPPPSAPAPPPAAELAQSGVAAARDADIVLAGLLAQPGHSGSRHVSRLGRSFPGDRLLSRRRDVGLEPMTRWPASGRRTDSWCSRPATPSARRRKDAASESLREPAADASPDPRAWENRVRDLSFVVAATGAVEAKSRRSKASSTTRASESGGQSFGAFAAMLLAGASVDVSKRGQGRSFTDPIPKAFLLVSPPGQGPAGTDRERRGPRWSGR